MATSDEPRVQAVDHSLDVLEALERHRGAGLGTLDGDLDISKSTIYSHLTTLIDRGYVIRDGDTYDLSLRFLRLGGYARRRHRLYRYARPAVDELAEELGELVAASTISNNYSVPVYQSRGERAVTTDSHVGHELPLHCTATGKAMLGALSQHSREGLVETLSLTPSTPASITDRSALLDELELIADQGYATDDEERIEGMRGVGVAISDIQTGIVVGALGMTAPVHRLDDQRFTETYPRLVSDVAREVEINITYD